MPEHRPANRITVEVLLDCGCMVAKSLYSLHGVATIGHSLSSAAIHFPAALQALQNSHTCPKEPSDGS